MPRKSPFPIALTPAQAEELEARARKYTLAYRDVIRAKLVLLAAGGMSNTEIAEQVDLPREVVSKWRKRFFEEGLAGLEDRPRGGRQAAFPPSGRR